MQNNEFDTSHVDKTLSEADDLLRNINVGFKRYNELELKRKAEPLMRQEQKAWNRLFGKSKEIEIPLPPQELFDVLEKAEELGFTNFEPHYLPKRRFNQEDTYPGWKVKPEQWYWDQITEGKIDQSAPELNGQWVLIDTIAKPHYDNGTQLYENDPLSDLLTQLRQERKIGEEIARVGEKSRYELSWDEIYKQVLPKIAHLLDLTGTRATIRLPKEIEFNILGNLYHPEWGDTSTWEWMNDTYEEKYYVIGGNVYSGGLARVRWDYSDDRANGIGFRPLIVFSS